MGQAISAPVCGRAHGSSCYCARHAHLLLPLFKPRKLNEQALVKVILAEKVDGTLEYADQ
jgi:hypothetical protein